MCKTSVMIFSTAFVYIFRIHELVCLALKGFNINNALFLPVFTNLSMPGPLD